MGYDLVIRNGTIVDGSGLAPYRADVGVVGDRIATIGRITDKGAREVDAEGRVVTPGFVDGHTHMDAQVSWDPLGTCSCWHGVTTVVMGNCGFTLAPAKPDQRHLVVRNLERAEDIAPEAMAAGIDWTWETSSEYLDHVDRAPKGLNYAAYVGHSALRTYAMGERAFEEAATEDDLAIMRHDLDEAMRAGAMGFSTSISFNHATSDDRPVASRLSSWSELQNLVGLVGQHGGLFELANDGVFRSRDDDKRNEYLGRLSDLAVRSGAPITFGLLEVGEPEWGWRPLLKMLDDVAARGGRMFGQAHCREFSVILSFKTRLPFDKLPFWSEVRAESLERQKELLAMPEVRRKLIDEAHHGDYGRAIGAETRKPDYDWIYVMDQAVPPHRTVAEVAVERGVDPVEVMIDAALATDMNQLFVQAVANFHPEALLEIMKHPRTVMTFSDSGAHVSQIMDSSIHTHLLSHWVRDRQDFTLEEAVRMITLEPARAWGFADRGLVQEGYVADLNVFDPATIAPAMPTIETDLPGGARRLKQKAVGIDATVVAGQVVHQNGEHTGALPGRLLRRKSLRG